MSARTDLRSYAGEHEPPFNLPRNVQGEPDSWWEAWPWLLCFLLLAIGILLWQAGVFA